MAQDDFGVRVCSLIPRTSKKGNYYYSGYCGNVSVALLKGRDVTPKGEAI